MALFIGLLIGLSLGLTGAGGSLVAVPLLMLLLNSSPQEATTLSLLGVFMGASFGVIPALFKPSSRAGILWIPAFLLLMLGALFAPLGRWVALYLPDQFLVFSFSLLALVIAFSMWRRGSTHQSHPVRALDIDEKSDTQWLCPQHNDQFQWRPRCTLSLALGGAAIGFLSGVYGVGGGFLIVPLLLLLAKVSMAVAVRTSLLVIAGVSAAGVASGLQLSTSMDLVVLFQIALGSVLGMLAASYLGSRLDAKWLQKLFSVLVVCLSVSNLMRYF